jgi:Tfp pilus assembly protein PilF
VLGIVAVLLAGGAIYGWVFHGRSRAEPHTPPEEDPRLTYNGPFQNVHPSVQYVGDAACAKCHQPIAESYRHHPMGRSILSTDQLGKELDYDARSHNPFKGLETEFRVEEKDGRISYRQTARDDDGEIIYDSVTPIDYALGSGTHGFSFLTNREGFVFQPPVSWFSHKHIWDVSPGYPPDWRSGRPVASDCLICHANRVQTTEGYMNRFGSPVFDGLSIGCERCHGPGERHVTKQEKKPDQVGHDFTIVNPRRLTPELRESVCNQCHITGEARVVPRGRGMQDYRPGLPFEAFRSILVVAAEPGTKRKAVDQVVQMSLSKCYAESVEAPEKGLYKLGCISCHDPHEHVAGADRSAHYRRACMQCHHEKGCSVPEETRRQTVKDDSCIECHMPRYSSQDIPHNASTDHRILRRPDKGESPGRSISEPTYDLFPENRVDMNNPERQRDLGIGLSQVMGKMLVDGQKASPRLGRRTLELLNEAVRNDPEDWEAWEAKAKALTVLNRTDEAFEDYKRVLAKQPHREISLMGAGMSAQSLDKYDDAVRYWGQAVAQSPWRASHRAAYAQALRQTEQWPEARKQAEEWVRLDPANVQARLMLVICLANCGQKDQARAEFSRIQRLKPRNLPELQARFEVEMRGR